MNPSAELGTNSRYRAAYPFQGETAGELSMNAGDLLQVLEPEQNGWIKVRPLRSPESSGYVPFAYLTPAAAGQSASNATTATATPAATTTATAPLIPSTSHNLNATDSSKTPLYAPQTGSQPQQPMSQPQPYYPQRHLGTAGQQQPGPLNPTSIQRQQSQQTQRRIVGHQRSGREWDPESIDRSAQNFGETLELWRERERRFMKGEAEKLPSTRQREYFYWDQNGNRIGPLTEQQMRAKLENREVDKQTKISLSTTENEELPSRSVNEYFPDTQVAFVTAPVAIPNSMMWTYVDDSGNVQGPFTAEQMRAWFQAGYFNAETKARLADRPYMQFAPLGIIFPEGQGAFLTEGDQNAAMNYVPSQPIPAKDPSELSAYAQGQSLYLQQQQQQPFAGNNPAMYGGAANPNNPFDPFQPQGQFQGQQNGAYGQPPPPQQYQQYQQQQQQAPNPFDNVDSNVDNVDLGIFDPLRDGETGKALLYSAMSDQEAPPPAISASQNSSARSGIASSASASGDDWGISWDDEEEGNLQSHRYSRQDSAVPLPIAGPLDDEDDGGTAKPGSLDKNEDKNTSKKSSPEKKVATLEQLKSRFFGTTENLYRFLTRPLPKDIGTIQCKIKRSLTGMHVNYNVYELYAQDVNGALGPQILVAHKHKSFTLGSYFKIEIGQVNPREAGTVIAELTVNTMGTNWVLHNDVPAHKGLPRDLCSVIYQKNIGKGPRKMQVALPAFKDEKAGTQNEWPHSGSTKNSKMLQALHSLDIKELQPLINKPPTWSKKHKAWTLNFHGRVTKPSVKNFQLVRPEDHDHVVLQHGRIGADSFTMDMSWPCSPISAFAICISSLYSKLAVE